MLNIRLVAEGLRENLAGSGFPVFGRRERDVSKSVFGTAHTQNSARRGRGQEGGSQMVVFLPTLHSPFQTIRKPNHPGGWGRLNTSDRIFSEI